MDETPRRRSSDRNRWTDDRMDDFKESLSHQLAALGPAVGQVALHAAKLDALDDVLTDLRDDLRETLALCKSTNGRVTSLERARISDEATRAERARMLEDTRASTALHITQRAWVMPAVAALLTALLLELLPHL